MLRSLIVAMSENRVIGRDGELPWHLSADLRRFKRLTMGHHIIMGRKTFDSIGRPLPGRAMIVVTRQRDFSAAGVKVAHDLQSAFALAAEAGDDEVFVIGGGEIYRQAIDVVDRLYLTEVHATVEGDTFFPTLDERRWRLVESDAHSADERNDHDFTFLCFERTDDDRDDQT